MLKKLDRLINIKTMKMNRKKLLKIIMKKMQKMVQIRIWIKKAGKVNSKRI
jgi:hypothetical protein